MRGPRYVRCATCRARFTAARSTARYCKPYCRLAAHRKRARRSVHFSSENERWRTPAVVLDRVRLVGPIILDPCGAPDSLVRATVEFYGGEIGVDGLSCSWRLEAPGEGIVFVNPPYGRNIGAWLEKCAATVEPGLSVIALPPARPGSRWWQAMCSTATRLCFWHQRIKFIGAKTGAPFPSAVVLWTREDDVAERFREAFSDVGRVVAP